MFFNALLRVTEGMGPMTSGNRWKHGAKSHREIWKMRSNLNLQTTSSTTRLFLWDNFSLCCVALFSTLVTYVSTLRRAENTAPCLRKNSLHKNLNQRLPLSISRFENNVCIIITLFEEEELPNEKKTIYF